MAPTKESFVLADDAAAALAGIDSEFLADLYDLVFKYGSEVRGTTGAWRIQLAKAPEQPLFVTACEPPSAYHHIVVSRFEAGLRVDQAHTCLFADGSGSMLVWERGIAPDEVRAAVAAVDEQFAEFRDSLGRRVRCPQEAKEPARLSVDAVFVKKTTVLYSRSSPAELEKVRLEFDRPEALAIVEHIRGHGVHGICRKEFEGFTQRVDANLLVLCRKYGITTMKDAHSLPPEEAEKMRQEYVAMLDRLQREDDNPKN